MRVRGSQMMRDNDVLNSPRILHESLSSSLDFFIGKMDVKQGLVQGLWEKLLLVSGPSGLLQKPKFTKEMTLGLGGGAGVVGCTFLPELELEERSV